MKDFSTNSTVFCSAQFYSIIYERQEALRSRLTRDSKKWKEVERQTAGENCYV